MKIAKNRSEAFKIEEKYEGLPHGWIQWKGTDVCMDVHCECGYHSHIDADFAYSVKCPACGSVYACNGHIELIKLIDEKSDPHHIEPKMDDADLDEDWNIENMQYE